uniref:uncharacterized protein LOC110598954 isoform X2 n=1 Tax=Ictidomys tridecemlineatus TaxID=43179 RepID=UPI001A9CE996|nr:uncharacterized protein LOC110598954 isoform X2 [Ictidomys tridecemlineatus]
MTAGGVWVKTSGSEVLPHLPPSVFVYMSPCGRLKVGHFSDCCHLLCPLLLRMDMAYGQANGSVVRSHEHPVERSYSPVMDVTCGQKGLPCPWLEEAADHYWMILSPLMLPSCCHGVWITMDASEGMEPYLPGRRTMGCISASGLGTDWLSLTGMRTLLCGDILCCHCVKEVTTWNPLELVWNSSVARCSMGDSPADLE